MAEKSCVSSREINWNEQVSVQRIRKLTHSLRLQSAHGFAEYNPLHGLGPCKPTLNLCPFVQCATTSILGYSAMPVQSLAHWHWSFFWFFDLQSVLAAPNELVLQMDTGLRTDSNPFRFTDDATPQASLRTLKKSDSIFSVDVRGSTHRATGFTRNTAVVVWSTGET